MIQTIHECVRFAFFFQMKEGQGVKMFFIVYVKGVGMKQGVDDRLEPLALVHAVGDFVRQKR